MQMFKSREEAERFAAIVRARIEYGALWELIMDKMLVLALQLGMKEPSEEDLLELSEMATALCRMRVRQDKSDA